MNTIWLAPFLAISIISQLAIAQTDSANVQNSKFFGSSYQKHNVFYDGHIIKVGITDMLSGLYGFHYEKEINRRFSAQVGAGITRQNFMQFYWEDATGQRELSEGFDYFQPPNEDLDDDIYDYETRESTNGFFVILHPKYYIFKEGFLGYYAGLNLEYRKYNFQAADIVPGQDDVEYTNNYVLDEYEIQNIYSGSVGYQDESSNFVYDFHLAAGYRSINGKRRDTGHIVTYNSSGYITKEAVALINDYGKGSFFFEVSFKIGVWWGSSETD